MMCLVHIADGAPCRQELTYKLGNVTHAVAYSRTSNDRYYAKEVSLVCTLLYLVSLTGGYWSDVRARWVIVEGYDG